jgi:glycine cleavage system regulatory protein
MCHLGGQFAGIARVEIPAEKAADFRQAVKQLEAQGLRVSVDAGEGAVLVAGGVAAVIELVGQDRPGILRNVTGVLSAHGVNVEELSSECVSAPMGGGTLFQARVRVSVPPAARLESVRADLEKIAADLMVDLTLRPEPRRG